jgi:hypothetical protein
MSFTYADLTPFALCCIGRVNDCVFQLPDGKYVRQGKLIDYDLICQHLMGKLTVGTYVISESNVCNFVVFDHDSSDQMVGLLVLLGIQSRLIQAGIISYLERSRRGGHLWVFCVPTHPALLRAWLLPYCPVDPDLEFYPKQDGLSDASPYGACIRVPLGIHRLTGERYRFVSVSAAGQFVDLFTSWREAFAFFAHVHTHRNVPPSGLMITESKRSPTDQKKYPSKTLDVGLQIGTTKDIAGWCLMHDPLMVIGRYVDLDGGGRGHCPFGLHHSDGVDSHPSFFVYRPTAPDIKCWYCHAWKQGGSLFDFLKLYYGMSARDLWIALQQGA